MAIDVAICRAGSTPTICWEPVYHDAPKSFRAHEGTEVHSERLLAMTVAISRSTCTSFFGTTKSTEDVVFFVYESQLRRQSAADTPMYQGTAGELRLQMAALFGCGAHMFFFGGIPHSFE